MIWFEAKRWTKMNGTNLASGNSSHHQKFNDSEELNGRPVMFGPFQSGNAKSIRFLELKSGKIRATKFITNRQQKYKCKQINKIEHLKIYVFLYLHKIFKTNWKSNEGEMNELNFEIMRYDKCRHSWIFTAMASIPHSAAGGENNQKTPKNPRERY